MNNDGSLVMVPVVVPVVANMIEQPEINIDAGVTGKRRICQHDTTDYRGACSQYFHDRTPLALVLFTLEPSLASATEL